jgi:FkbM family methyltransferase
MNAASPPRADKRRTLRRQCHVALAQSVVAPAAQQIVAGGSVRGYLPSDIARRVLTMLSIEGGERYPTLCIPTLILGHQFQLEGNLRYSNFLNLWFRDVQTLDNPLKLWLFTRLARDATTVFDIGANVGLFTLLALVASPESRVIAVEPNPGLARLLLSNIRRNGMAHRAEVVERGLTDVDGEATFHMTAQSTEGTLLRERIEQQHLDVLEAVQVRLSRLDSLCDELHVDPSSACMKIDVEGAETRLLAGCERFIHTRSPRDLIVEMLRSSLEAGLIDTLIGFGFACYKIQGEQLVPVASTVEGIALYDSIDYDYFVTRRSHAEVTALLAER